MDNTKRFEKTTLLNVVHPELRVLSNAALWDDGLRGQTSDYPELARATAADTCTVAKYMYWDFMHYSLGEVVFIDDAPCKISCCVRLDTAAVQQFALLVIPLSHEERVTETVSRWRLRRELNDHIAYLSGAKVRHAPLWDLEDDAHVLAIKH